MRRYDDPVEVRKGRIDDVEGPDQFLWRGKLWKVRAVLAHWVETGAWWQSAGARAVIGTDDYSVVEPGEPLGEPESRPRNTNGVSTRSAVAGLAVVPEEPRNEASRRARPAATA
jgi:hypothetical protein